MSITIKSNPDGVSGAIQVNGVDKVTVGASGITAGSFAPNSIDAAAAALAFSGANQSLALNGYQKLPSGLIIQWGKVPTSTAGLVTVTFPIPFPTALLVATVTPITGADSNLRSYSITNGVAASLTVQRRYSPGNAAALPAGEGFYWIALGY